jgi:hypothetical protein
MPFRQKGPEGRGINRQPQSVWGEVKTISAAFGFTRVVLWPQLLQAIGRVNVVTEMATNRYLLKAAKKTRRGAEHFASMADKCRSGKPPPPSGNCPLPSGNYLPPSGNQLPVYD